MKKFFTVLGGMGTLATESYMRILDQRTPTKRDQDYLDYIVVNHATVPDRTSWILDHSKPNPTTALIEDIKQQSLLNPEFFVLICNTAHYSFDELQAATDVPILNMLQETVDEIKRLKPDAIQEMTEDLIYHDIKESGHSDGKKYHELVRKMIEEENCDIVILGCTELSYAEEMNPETKYPVADSQSIIVDRTIDRAMKIRNEN